MLKGASNISPEIAKAVFTLLFHTYNQKLEGERHVSNKKIPIVTITPSLTDK